MPNLQRWARILFEVLKSQIRKFLANLIQPFLIPVRKLLNLHNKNHGLDRTVLSSCSQILSPWLGYIVDSDIRLSYRPAGYIAWQAGTAERQPYARVDYITQSGTMNLATGQYRTRSSTLRITITLVFFLAALLAHEYCTSSLFSTEPERLERGVLCCLLKLRQMGTIKIQMNL